MKEVRPEGACSSSWEDDAISSSAETRSRAGTLLYTCGCEKQGRDAGLRPTYSLYADVLDGNRYYVGAQHGPDGDDGRGHRDEGHNKRPDEFTCEVNTANSRIDHCHAIRF